ncbi:hypothetical protein [Vreelandella nanhaiensis]|uniref:Uncharacterized protein n=1 Tax=Vreelandella nanhaiensis TaxID=1258546 RepID=A0A3S0XQT9_9GAMM|nr:hypothetical protein [Halomonas nanhaiensis]RUR27684.1 hypothetical protein ELY38_18640 [Halomonas nanhaiensis]
MKRFNYKIHYTQSNERYIQFDARLQNQGAQIGLTPFETEELWLTYAEMPTALAGLVDERIWEAHRKPILEMLAAHYLTPSD